MSHSHQLTILCFALIFQGIPRNYLEHIDESTVADSFLSEQETRVLREAARGLTNREIAARLYISETTVKTYLSRLFAKLEVNDRTAAVAKAIETLGLKP